MAKEVFTNKAVTASEANYMTGSYVQDLTALFRLMQDDLLGILESAKKKGMTPSELENKIKGIF